MNAPPMRARREFANSGSMGATGMDGFPRRLVHRAAASSSAVYGYIYDRDDASRKFTVEFWADGVAVAVRRADLLVEKLAQPDGFDRRCGFHFALPPAARAARHWEIRLANLDVLLASGIPVGDDDLRSVPTISPGRVQWEGGLRLTGWVRATASGAPANVRFRIGDALVATATATDFANIAGSQESEAALGFSVHLPERLADGELHVVDAIDDAGAPLAGSPVGVVAFPDGLRGLVLRRGRADLEGLRAELYDRLIPQSLPFTMFEAWRKNSRSRRRP